MNKKIKLGALALLILLAIGVFFLTSNLDGFIKKAIEQYGTEITQVPTKVGDVNVSLSSGEGSLKGFTLDNPEGFSKEKALAFGLVSLSINKKSIMDDGPIIINNVLIDAPAITYEITENGNSNLQKILDNISAYTVPAPEENSNEPQAQSQKVTKERKIIINSLTISNGSVQLHHVLLEGKKIPNVNLPTLQLFNIGRQKDGLSSQAIVKIVLGQITSKAIEIGQASVVKELKNQGIESLKSAVKESDIGKALDSVMGK